MTDLDFDAELAVCEAATPGPWEQIEREAGEHDGEALWRYGVWHEDQFPTICLTPLVGDEASSFAMADMTFVAAARTGYPEALRRIKRLRELCSAVFVRPGEQVTATAKAATEIRELLNIKET